jgi:sulfonate transport system ATP-binding protein
MDGSQFGGRPGKPGAGVAVAVRGLERRFGENRVLRGIDLDIAAGTFVAVVGRSGCGKSTLLRLIAGLEAANAGSVQFDGAAPGAGDVRLMFQEPRLLPWARVADNVEVGLGARRREPAARAAARAKLSEVGLAERAREWPARLSGGQKQRVALARALASQPRLLALDEPLGALDALTRIEMQDLLARVWADEGFTAVLVTHDVSEAVALADRVVLLEAGTVALDLPITLPRPRRRGSAAAAALEAQLLERLLRQTVAA